MLYLYNSGIRIGKTANDVTYRYYLEGSRIIAEDRTESGTTKKLFYYYDVNGICGFSYHDGASESRYIYRKNLQGDITDIIDSSGNIVASYTYDSWGNVLTKTGTLADVNPFRYRGYYQDNETGWYYLNSRYYDSLVGRFINADDVGILSETAGDINGLNLYAYCYNNPVMYIDPSGELVISLLIIGFFIGAGVAGGISIVAQGLTVGWDNINWWQVGLDALIGGISGAFAATGLGIGWQIGINAFLGGAGSIGGNLLNGEAIDWVGFGLSVGIGALAGWAGRAGAQSTKSVMNTVKGSKNVIKWSRSIGKVLDKIDNGLYSTLRGQRSAYTQIMNKLSNAIFTAGKNAMNKSLSRALKWSFTGSFVNGIAKVLRYYKVINI